MTDEPIIPAEGEPEPVAEPLVHEPTAEEIEAARLAAIAENDAAVERDVRRLSRRGFIVAGVAAAAGLGGWKFLRTRPREGDVSWPLRRSLETNERLATAYFDPKRLSPTFDPSRITRPARINGGEGLTADYDPENWRLRIEGAASAVALTLDDIRALPRRDLTTELRCIEGWSIVVHWTGVQFADVMARYPPPHPVRYVGMETPGRGYYVGLDIESALHPQTLLAYALNGEPLSWQHGAPLRLAIPVKYGVKNIKRIGTIRYSNVRPADFWAERGYDWYCGH